MIIDKQLFNDAEAAEFIGVQPQTLRDWRHNKRYALPYVKVGRLVRYRRHDLLNWLESRLVVVGAGAEE